ncbi:MAG TPA: PspC domain-containing protein, partial [Candidatus Saccharimonadales bacterium]|nr:PspC domain-containing protein [Candidatus Saccharimonadales bacterium]
MTTRDTQRADASGRILRRRSTDRVIGGVAGGLGDYFNVDPLLLRIGFVGLMIFGGAGLVLYVVAWLLIPVEGQDASIVEGILQRVGLTSSRLAWIAVAVLAIIIISNLSPRGVDLSTGRETFFFDPAALWAVAVIVVGFLLLRRRETVPAMTVVASQAAPLATPAVQTPPRPRSPLGWYVCASLLIAIGLLAIASQVGNVQVQPGQFFGVALAVIGIGLVVGAWWGRARILILLAILLVPLAVAASFVTAPLVGGVGDYRYTPANAAELHTEYRSLAGRVVLDLRDLSVTSAPIHIAASVAVGELRVILPIGASVRIAARVGAGSAIIFNSRDDDTSL